MLEVRCLVSEQVQRGREAQARGVLHDAVVRSALEKFKEGHRLVVDVEFLGIHLPHLHLTRNAVEVFNNLLLAGVVRGHAIGNH